MKEEKNQVREHWGGSLGFVLAAAGSAIGLGNLWKFPYVTGQNGGGAFILVYLLAVLVIGFPVMVCEISIGRNAQSDPISAFQKLCPKKTGSTHMAGVLLLLAACGLFCFGKFGLAGLFVHPYTMVASAAFYEDLLDQEEERGAAKSLDAGGV